MKNRWISFTAAAAFSVVAAAAHAGQVWSPDYEEYIDADFTQHVICARPPAGADPEGLVWSDQYEEYVAADLPVLVIRSQPGEGHGETVYREEYEAYVADNLPQLNIPQTEACSLS